MTVFAAAALLAFPAAMSSAAFVDLTTMKIPNRLVLLLLGAYALFAPLTSVPPMDMAKAMAVAAGVLVVCMYFFARGWMGGGDAKLMAVTALWLGADHAAAFLLATAVFGAALTLGLLAFRSSIMPARWYGHAWILHLHAPTTGIPYGIAIAAAGLFVFFDTPWADLIR